MNLSDIHSFAENLKKCSMNRINEVSNFEFETTFEKSIIEIKHNHLKSIAYADIYLSVINSIDENIEQLSMNSKIEVAKFGPEPMFENTINNMKNTHLKFITSIDINVSPITFNKPYLYYEHLRANFMPRILL